MNILDIGFLVSCGAGFLRGRKRGLGRECSSIIKTLVPLLAGCGLFKLGAKFVSFIPGLNPENSGVIGFSVIILCVYILIKKLIKKFTLSLEEKFGKGTSSRAGILGTVRYAMAALGIITGIELLPGDLLSGNSTLANLIGKIVGTS